MEATEDVQVGNTAAGSDTSGDHNPPDWYMAGTAATAGIAQALDDSLQHDSVPGSSSPYDQYGNRVGQQQQVSNSRSGDDVSAASTDNSTLAQSTGCLLELPLVLLLRAPQAADTQLLLDSEAIAAASVNPSDTAYPQLLQQCSGCCSAHQPLREAGDCQHDGVCCQHAGAYVRLAV